MFNIILTLRNVAAGVLTALLALYVLVSSLFLSRKYSWELGVKCWAAWVLRCLGVRVHVDKPEKAKMRALYVMNHQGMAELMTLPLVAPGSVSFVAKKELLKFPFAGQAMKRSGCIFIDRGRSDKAVQSIKDGVKNLPSGYSVLLYPEGTRSGLQGIAPFKKGLFYIARQAKLPIVPIAQVGGDLLSPNRSPFTKAGDVFISVGDPIDTSDWKIEEANEKTEFVRQKVIEVQKKAETLRTDYLAKNQHTKTRLKQPMRVLKDFVKGF